MVSSYVGENKTFERLFLSGQLEVELTPQGTLAERIRAGGAGIPAFYTATGYGTVVADGKETREFDGRTYVMETALTADFALVKAWKGDRFGNLVYRKTARNFNPMMATAAKVTIAEVEELVEPGSSSPIRSTRRGSTSRAILQERKAGKADRAADRPKEGGVMPVLTRDQVAQRAARELRDGMYVNLGHRDADAGGELRPRRHRHRAAVGERPAGHRTLSLRGRRGSRPDQRRQADGHRSPRAAPTSRRPSRSP